MCVGFLPFYFFYSVPWLKVPIGPPVLSRDLDDFTTYSIYGTTEVEWCLQKYSDGQNLPHHRCSTNSIQSVIFTSTGILKIANMSVHKHIYVSSVRHLKTQSIVYEKCIHQGKMLLFTWDKVTAPPTKKKTKNTHLLMGYMENTGLVLWSGKSNYSKLSMKVESNSCPHFNIFWVPSSPWFFFCSTFRLNLTN